MKNAIAIALVISLTGCASIVRGTEEDVRIEVTPEFADVTTDNGRSCKGSCTLSVPRKEKFTVTASAPGYQSESVFVDTKVSGGGVATSVIGNALAGGVVGGAIDGANGATLDHTPNPVIIDLKRNGAAPVS